MLQMYSMDITVKSIKALKVGDQISHNSFLPHCTSISSSKLRGELRSRDDELDSTI